jgi:hypothetical protein
MDCRVKPGNDGTGGYSSGLASLSAPDFAALDPAYSLPPHFTQFPGGALMRRR